MKNPILTIRHPDYTNAYSDYRLWRLIQQSGQNFLNEYLYRFYAREDENEYQARKKISYVPAHAKVGLLEIKNSIFQHLIHVLRKSPSQKYLDACRGVNGGVDNRNTSMVGFLGNEVIVELLAMGKVCIYVDAPQIDGNSRRDEIGFKPYIYTYPAEKILSWSFGEDQKLSAILLADEYPVIDQETGLTKRYARGYKYLRKTDDGVLHQKFSLEGEKRAERILQIPEIPCTILEIKDSLLRDVSKHQITLTQLASSDANYTVSANFPFYTEQYNAQRTPTHIRNADEFDNEDGEDTSANREENPDKQVNVGIGRGRRYPKGLERPGFVHPSPEPLEASMSKQKDIRNEIRQLMSLALANLGETAASPDSRNIENRSLEMGLFTIGNVLQKGEMEVAQHWINYEGITGAIEVVYPSSYSLNSDEENEKEIKDIRDDLEIVTSTTYRKEAQKRLVKLTMRNKVDQETLNKIYKEIDDSSFTMANQKLIIESVKEGILAAEDAELILGLPEGTAKKAQQEHAERLKRIQESQSQENPAARGVPDLGGDSSEEKKEGDA